MANTPASLAAFLALAVCNGIAAATTSSSSSFSAAECHSPASGKFTAAELSALNVTAKISYDVDMDPCKAGEWKLKLPGYYAKCIMPGCFEKNL